MTRSLVEKIRLAYATGKYDKLSLFLSYKDAVKAEDIDNILDYKIYPEIAIDSKQRIIEVPIAQKYYAEYQDEIRVLVKKDLLANDKYYPFPEAVELARGILVDKLKELTTIKYENLRGFYLEDMGAES